MKLFIALIGIAYLIQSILCDSLLSKFHQHGYKMKDTRLQLISYDNNSFNFVRLKAFKFNRTTTAHNATFQFKVNVEDKLDFVCQVRKFLSNEYRYFPIRFRTNLKKAFDAHVMGMGKEDRCGNITAVFNKNVTYHICNFVIDDTRFPPLVPDGKYRADVHILYLDREVAILYFYSEVYTPMNYPKH